MNMKKSLAFAMAGAMVMMPFCMAEEEGRGDLIIDRNGDGVEDIGYIAAASEDFTGNWQDEVTQRATMEVTLEGDTLHFCVSWADSADETTQWVFSGVPCDDGVVEYNDGEIRTVKGDGSDYDVVKENTSGCVAIDNDGAIYWTDTEYEDSSTMRFIKVPD